MVYGIWMFLLATPPVCRLNASPTGLHRKAIKRRPRGLIITLPLRIKPVSNLT